VKTYRKKLIIIILSLFISYIILDSLLFSHKLYYSPGAIFSQSMIDTKLGLLKDLPPSKKTIFIGGSSVSYGVDCELLSQKFEPTSFNFGCMVGLGPEILFENIKTYLNSGDTIVFCLEYGTYNFERTNRNLNYLALMLGPQEKVFRELPALDQLSIKLYFPLKQVRYSLFSLLSSTHSLNQIYKCGWSFDRLGNVTSNNGNKKSFAELELSPLSPLLSEIAIHEDLNIIMNNILHFTQKNGIKTLATWPNTYKNSSYEGNELVFNNLNTIKMFWQEHGIDIIGNPTDAMLSAEYFYDSVYHLNKEGTKIRTLQLVNDLHFLK
jgi:hypothetical protein